MKYILGTFYLVIAPLIPVTSSAQPQRHDAPPIMSELNCDELDTRNELTYYRNSDDLFTGNCEATRLSLESLSNYVSAIRQYENGKLNGISEEWNEKLRMVRHATFINGAEHDIAIWDTNGKLVSFTTLEERIENQKLAAIKKQQEDQKKQQELEQRLKQEELEKVETEKKNGAEAIVTQRLADEQIKQEALHDSQAFANLPPYMQDIVRSVRSVFNSSGLPSGLSCNIYIRIAPGGDVITARINKSSGNTMFDTRAVTAVMQASPLPLPEDESVLGKMQEINLYFKP